MSNYVKSNRNVTARGKRSTPIRDDNPHDRAPVARTYRAEQGAILSSTGDEPFFWNTHLHDRRRTIPDQCHLVAINCARYFKCGLQKISGTQLSLRGRNCCLHTVLRTPQREREESGIETFGSSHSYLLVVGNGRANPARWSPICTRRLRLPGVRKLIGNSRSQKASASIGVIVSSRRQFLSTARRQEIMTIDWPCGTGEAHDDHLVIVAIGDLVRHRLNNLKSFRNNLAAVECKGS